MRHRQVRLLDWRVDKELAEKSLREFLRLFAWPVLWPATQFVDGWHIHAMCEHLEAVARGDIQRLIINLPFRHLKSTLVSQAFPAWDWIKHPSRQFLTASYAADIAVRDAVDARRIIESPGYRAAFGDIFRLTTDQNVKGRYENDKRGTRKTTSTEATGGTGFGGDIRIVDDPVSAKQADNLIAIKKSIEFWKGTLATRANDPRASPTVVVHQRMNANDLTGYLLAEEVGWEHLVLPMRYDPKLRKTTSLGFMDPRTIPGEMLHPERIDDAMGRSLEKSIGAYHTAAQLQQNPDLRGGIIFARDKWKYWRELPTLDETVLSVDCTFKDLQTSDYVAIQAWGNRQADSYLLLNRIKERMGFSATVQAIRNMVALFPDSIAVLIEDKANGSAVIETLMGEIPGVIAVQPDGGKAARAYAMQPSQEVGNIWLPDPSVDPSIESFVSTCSRFTGAEGGDDDEVDAMTQYVNWRRARSRTGGLADLMRQQYEAKMAAQKAANEAAAARMAG